MVLRPPEEIDGGAVLLRRCRTDDAAVLSGAVARSLEHLRPWLPWATDGATRPGVQEAWVEEVQRRWAQASDFSYIIWDLDGRELLGLAGLHRRVGPGGIEIGYWLHVDHLQHGYARAAAQALTGVALSLPGIARVEIHCDVANTRSAAVARSLGYRLVRLERDAIEAPGETGSRMIWVIERGPEEVS